ncbi:MAG: hypothetical protein LBO06_06400 [Bacteroidales bacterium]|jgi:hypothetical protein|nr:hypothetical protein [Bacteroidales bacterium]
MKYHKILALALIVSGIYSADLSAQNNEKIHNETVIVTSTFNPIVSEARKIDERATTMDMELKKETFSLNPIEKPFQPTMPLETIKPAKVKGEPIEMLYNTHVAAGIGTYLTPYLDISYSQTRSRDFIYSAHARHYSSLWGNMTDVAHSTFADNNIDLFAKKIWNSCFLDASLYYNYSRNYWYGFNPDTLYAEPEKKDYRVSFNNVGFRLNYGSLFRDEDMLHHKATFDINNTSSIYGISETDVLVSFSARKNMDFWNGKPQVLGINLAYQHILFNNEFDVLPYFDTDSIYGYDNSDNGLLTINPYLEFSLPHLQELSFHAGVTMIPTFGTDDSKFHIMPEIFAYYPVIKDLLHLKAGITGSITPKNLNKTRLENPYISPSILLMNEKELQIFVQVMSNPAPTLTMQLDMGINLLTNKGFFALDEEAQLNNMFVLHYDDGNQYYAKFQLHYTLTKTLNILLDAQVQGFDLDNITAAYYMPTFIAHFAVEYLIAKKLRLQFTPSFLTASDALDQNGTLVSLSPRIDLNLAAQYDFNKQLSLFINLNNLAFQRQYQYINYPSQRFMAMIGAKFAF